MRQWIRLPRIEGRSSRQAHCDLPEGTYERELGREGFFGPSAQMYHRHPPTAWRAWEGPLRPRAFDLSKLAESSNTPWTARTVLSNDSLQLRFWRVAASMDHLVRNGDGDELLFIHHGDGELFCDYGHLNFRDGDYVVLPRDTAWRIQVKAEAQVLLIEATNDSYQLPDKGLLGNHAIFDPAILDTPRIDEVFLGQQDEHEWRIAIKRRNRLSTVSYPFNPLDAVGWHGDLAPVRLNWRDLRPVSSHRYHLPPSVHVTFVAERFMVGTFAPRPIESDPGALRVPFFHNDDDIDEVIFCTADNSSAATTLVPGCSACILVVFRTARSRRRSRLGQSGFVPRPMKSHYMSTVATQSKLPNCHLGLKTSPTSTHGSNHARSEERRVRPGRRSLREGAAVLGSDSVRRLRRMETHAPPLA